MKAEVQIGIVSEIRVGILVKSENKYLSYPCKVVVHVMERDIYGGILKCTVNTGEGTYVLARRAEFIDLSEPLSYNYQTSNPAKILKDYQSLKTYKKAYEYLSNLNDQVREHGEIKIGKDHYYWPIISELFNPPAKKKSNENNDEQPFRKGTLNCPECKQKLHFECIGTMRVKREINGQYLYDAKCVTKGCSWSKKYIQVVAPND